MVRHDHQRSLVEGRRSAVQKHAHTEDFAKTRRPVLDFPIAARRALQREQQPRDERAAKQMNAEMADAEPAGELAAEIGIVSRGRAPFTRCACRSSHDSAPRSRRG